MATTTSNDLTMMMAYGAMEPFGAQADDFRAGQICAVIANVNRDPEKRPEAWTAADFMPALAVARDRANAPPKDETPEQMAARLDRKLFGARLR